MKRNLLLTIALSALAVPVLANAQVSATSSPTTEAQVFTACSQTAIEVRDESIGSARTAYNNAMAVALDARKEAEKKAVAIDDEDDKKDAIKDAVDAYKKAVNQAQDTLIKARKEAWNTFETNTKICREMNKDKRDTPLSATATKTSIVKQEVKTEKTFKESFLESLKNLFKMGDGN